MNTVKVRDIEIGAGAPKIIVPIVGVTKKDIIDEAKTFDSIPVDVVEWPRNGSSDSKTKSSNACFDTLSVQRS
jgi:hypothetical protein